MYNPRDMELGSSSLVLPSSRELQNKEVWSEAEDLLLKRYIEEHGPGNWGQVPLRAGLNRCPESCRLRWFNILQPIVKRGEFEPDEVDVIIRMHKLFGNRWSLIAGRFPGRTADDIKNYYNTHLSMEKSYFECKLPLPNIRSIEINHSVTSTKVFRPVPRRIPEFKTEEKDHEYSSSSTANNNNTVSGFRNTTNFHGMEHQKNNGSSTDNYFWNFDADQEVENSAAKAGNSGNCG